MKLPTYTFKPAPESAWLAAAAAVGTAAGAIAALFGADAQVSAVIGSVVAGAVRPLLGLILPTPVPDA